MKTILRISIAGKTQNYSEADLPLALDATSGKDVVFGGPADTESTVWFEYKDQQVFLCSEKDSTSVLVKGKTLSGSVRLKPDDEIEINTTKFTVKLDSEVVVLSPLAPPAFAPLPGKKIRPGLRNGIILFFVLLLFGIIYVLLAAPVRVTVLPVPETVSLSGFPPSIKIGDRYLALPSQYYVTAKKVGYHKLYEPIEVKLGSDAVYNFKLFKLPGLMNVISDPVSGAQVHVDGIYIGQTPLSLFEIEAGLHDLSISAPRYLTATQTVEIEGMGDKQSLQVTLIPDWGTLQVNSNPEGADVLLNGKLVGPTPLETEPVGGDYKMELRKEGWKTILETVTVEPGKILSMPLFELQKVDGTLELTSIPTDARVTLNGQFRGNTPLTLKIMSEKEHQLSVAKNAFMTATQSLRVEQDKVKQINVQLEPEYGTVFIISKPADAQLLVDGKTIEGPASRRLRLTTLPHQIEISKKGYESFTTTLTPTAGLSKRINAQLLSQREARQTTEQPEIKTAKGQILRRIYIDEPIQFQMGATRREAGRRSNETQYTVELTKTFDISIKEVTNAEFQEFQREHESGDESGFDLSESYQPVASVEWDQTARYLNWLSEKDGLPPAYEEKEGKMIARAPVTTGYRLPTEAEWVYVARYEGEVIPGKKPAKYPWGNDRIPPANSGNYADNSVSRMMPIYIKGYRDGYEVASPVGQFPANSLGIYDLGGNVSEWCHDIYDVNLGGQNKVLRDPTGAATGIYHVIRGASWRHGSIRELRLTYRDYTDKYRNDLGFRIARYAEEHTDE